MAQVDAQLSTGLPGLDRVLKGLIPGDNIVWQVDSIEDYLPFAEPYCRNALECDQRLIYFRFARHRPLVDADTGADIHHLHPEAGFEQFITEVHKVIKDVGKGGYYLFDCLSDLAVDWYSDQMLGNFFMLTCPYLYDAEAIACFPLLRNHHSFYATSPITETTQVLLDIRRHAGTLHVHPMKVQQRYSPTMYMLHAWQGNDFVLVTQSARISEILQAAPRHGLESPSYRLDVWSRTFLQAEETLAAIQRGEAPPEKTDECFQRLLRMAISRHGRMLGLAEKHLTLLDLLDIGRRMVGTGLIGGKSVGMLLARAILEQADTRWTEVLEPHDSFFIGSDVFYTFFVTNGIWWIRQRKQDLASFMEGAEAARRRILVGAFPEYIEKQFADMLDYFGQSPIIVRSSSLLEDNFGNAFAGKYESVFCVNQGPRHKRLEDFLSAVRTIYASTMSQKALTYRAQRGMLDHDEQMALLVQRVSGAVHDELFYPQVAGVGLSFNPYVWSRDIDPEAGVLRLVFALGTRAVDRHDDDYTRVVALNAPEKRPESNFDEARQYTQRKVDVLDLAANQLLSRSFSDVAERSPDLPMEMFASQDEELARRAAESGRKDVFSPSLTFEKLLSETQFVADMCEILKTLQAAYDSPVDVEFTANFLGDRQYKINLLQCRPFQGKGGGTVPEPPRKISKNNLVLEAHGAVIGQSREAKIDRLIYVVPSAYGRLPISDRHRIARLIGQITHVEEANKPATTMLLGPGRWGTTTPSLGVPISFSDINTVSALCEIVAMREGLVPEVSLGTHLFSEMVELDILYLALFPARESNFLNSDFFEKAPNKLTELLPGAAEWADTVRIIDAADLGGGVTVKLNANTIDQKVVCYLEHVGSDGA
ncbi:MAG: PEP/pyruvate-binding domain-containing protein [Planctomycetota bacterium]|nr:PEP/pyruvate-binding domain-containing protein [Planctomycetota bacterium]